MSVENERIVLEINASFEREDLETFLNYCDENIVWTIIGDATKTGKESIREWMAAGSGCEPPVIGVERMISTDDTVVCHGEMTMKAKDGEPERYSYCDIYTFSNGLVTELKTFVVKSRSDEPSAVHG